MNIAKIIEQFGYKPNEVKVYLTALNIAESTASSIATNAGLPLSSTQSALENLHKDGLMNFYVRKHHKYWVAEQPDKLMQIFKEREAELSLAIKDIKAIKSDKVKPSVEVFIGTDEIKLIHDDMLTNKHHIRAIIPWEAWNNLLGSDYLDDFIDLRRRHFLNMRMLVPKNVGTIKLKEKDSKELRQTKFLPENISIEDALFIFGDNVAIITLNESQPTGVVIQDAATTRMMTVFFEDIWER